MKEKRPFARLRFFSPSVLATSVAFYDRDLVGHAVANANAEQAAIGYGENGLNELISVAGCILERIEPGVNTNLNVVEQQEGSNSANGNKKPMSSSSNALKGS